MFETPTVVPVLLRAECWLTLFAFAGILKGNPAIAALGMPDLTATLGLLSLEALLLESWLVRRLPRPSLSWAEAWLALCCLVVGLGALRNPHLDYAWSKTARFVFLAVAASYGLPRCIAGVRQSAEDIAHTVILIVSTLGTAFTVAAFTHVAGATPVSFGGTYQSWGYFAGASALCTLALFAEHESTRTRLLLGVVLAIQTAAVGVCGARGPLIALTAALVLAGAGVLGIRPKRWGALVTFSGIAALGVALLLAPASSRERVGLLVAEDKGPSIELRESGYGVALDMFAAQPVFGAGTGSYAVRDPYLQYPHNVLLEVMAESGLVGVAAFSGFILAVTCGAWGAWRRARTRGGRTNAAALFVLCFFFGVGAMFSGDIANRELFFALGLLTAVSVASRRPTRVSSVESATP